MKDRIKEFRRVTARELSSNQQNLRRHPETQLNALRAIISEVGFASALVAYETPEGLVLIDGHARVESAMPDSLLPTLILDVDQVEAEKLLATMDTIASMAESDIDALSSLLDDLSFEEADLQKLASSLLEIEQLQIEEDSQGDRETLLALRPHEHYDYVVILARTSREWNNLCDILDIGEAVYEKGHGLKKIGLGRGISATEFIRRISCG